MSKQRAFIRYTKKGKIVPGSLIISNSYPNSTGAIWREIDMNLCCDATPTPEPPGLRFTTIIAPGGEQGCFSVQTIDDGGPDVNGVIDWGDGTIDNIVIPANTYDTFTHNYLEGSYTATVTFDTPERIVELYINCND